MFSGIIKEVGAVKEIRRKSTLWHIGVASIDLCRYLKTGASTAVNGVCLTVTQVDQKMLYFDAVKTTLDVTNLKRLRVSSPVNLEPPVKAGDDISGHFVLGHIDCESRIRSLSRKGKYFLMTVGYDRKFSNYIVEKGSVAVDGISLTVQKLEASFFTVSIIPYTFEHTALKYRKTGDWVNIEFDYLLKRR